MTTANDRDAGAHVLGDVLLEFARLDAIHGEHDRRDGTSRHDYGTQAEQAAGAVRRARTKGKLTWRHVLAEHYWAALAQTDRQQLRRALVSLAAHALLWAAAIDRSAAATSPASGAPSPAPENPHSQTDTP